MSMHALSIVVKGVPTAIPGTIIRFLEVYPEF